DGRGRSRHDALCSGLASELLVHHIAEMHPSSLLLGLQLLESGDVELFECSGGRRVGGKVRFLVAISYAEPNPVFVEAEVAQRSRLDLGGHDALINNTDAFLARGGGGNGGGKNEGFVLLLRGTDAQPFSISRHAPPAEGSLPDAGTWSARNL